MTIQEGSKEERVGGGGDSVLPGWEWGRGLPLTGTLCAPCSTVRTKVYAVLELWVQVCGASAGVLQGGASGEALLSHLLSDISPPADALRVREASQHPWSSPDPASRPFCLPAGWCVICVPSPASCAAPGGALTRVCRLGSPGHHQCVCVLSCFSHV